MDYTFSDGALVELTAMSDPGHSFTGWDGDLAGTQNPIQLIMDADKGVMAMFTEDIIEPPPNTDRVLTVIVEGAGSVMVNQISQPPPSWDKYYGRIYKEDEADFRVPGDFPDIYSINYSQIPGGSKILISGTYKNTWRPNGLSNIIFLFKDFVMDGQGTVEHAIYINGGNGVEFHSIDGNVNNAIFREYTGKVIDQHGGTNMWFDGFHLRTELDNSGGQTDLFYLQDINGLKVTNCNGIIYTEGGSGHNDCLQMYRISGEVLISHNWFMQDNHRTTNNQGIYLTTPGTGNFIYQNNYITGNPDDVLKSRIKNCLTFRRLGASSDVHITIRDNYVYTNGYHPIIVTEIIDSSHYTIENNVVEGNYTGDAITITH